MEISRTAEVVKIFRQLTPANRSYFMEILQVAEAAEKNGKEASGAKENPTLHGLDVQT